MRDDTYVHVRFGQTTGTYWQDVVDVDTLQIALNVAKLLKDRQVVRLWPWAYIAIDGIIVENIVGPDLIGSSIEFAHDFFQSYKPVSEDFSKGDSI